MRHGLGHDEEALPMSVVLQHRAEEGTAPGRAVYSSIASQCAALTFASLLIIGGRLGDVYGHRRIFVIGAALFGGGSLLAALSWSIPSLIVGAFARRIFLPRAGGIQNQKRPGRQGLEHQR